MKIQDQLHRALFFNETPKRIVSLVPSQTELLVDLGLIEHIVGVTKFCVHPDYIRKTKTIVGGTKDIKLEKIKALQPDIILCNKEENTQNIVNACKKICNVHVSDIASIEDGLELINQYGTIFSIKDKCEELVDSITIEIDNFKDFIKIKPPLKVAYFIWKDPWMVAAKGTYIDYLLDFNKFDNVFDAFERYPEISLELLKKYSPDLIFLSSEPYPFKEKHVEEIKNNLPNAKTILVNGEAFSWYGSHIIQACAYFKKLRQQLE